jgi:hypothetical protein
VSASAPGTLSLLTRERSTGSPASASPGTFPARCRAAEFGKRTRDPSGTSDAPELFPPRHSSRASDNETETKPVSTVGGNFFRAQHFPISICDLWADPRAAPAGLGQSVTPSAAASREVRKGRERPLLTGTHVATDASRRQRTCTCVAVIDGGRSSASKAKKRSGSLARPWEVVGEDARGFVPSGNLCGPGY